MTAPNWSGATVPSMWNSAQAADTQQAWQQVSAWYRTSELLSRHMDVLRLCRNELTSAWPPGRSPAATAFVEYVDGLLVQMGQARDDAARNHRALAGVLASLAATKADMGKLKAEWDRYEAEDANRAQNLSNILPHSAGTNWQDDLNQKARTRMSTNDQEVFEASRLMVDMTGPWHDGRREPPEQLGAGPGEPSPQPAASGFGQPGSGMSPVPVVSVSDVDRGAGLAESPVTQPPPVSGTQIPSPGVSTPPVGGGVVPPVPVLPGVGGTRPGARAQPATPGLGVRTGGVASGGFGRSAVGGPVPVASGPAGRSGRGAGPGRVNPVGGVINAGGSGVHGTGTMPLAAAGGLGRGSDTAAREPALTLQWEVPVGGAPVIEPEPERPFQLGPGVIGPTDGAVT